MSSSETQAPPLLCGSLIPTKHDQIDCHAFSPHHPSSRMNDLSTFPKTPFKSQITLPLFPRTPPPHPERNRPTLYPSSPQYPHTLSWLKNPKGNSLPLRPQAHNAMALSAHPAHKRHLLNDSSPEHLARCLLKFFTSIKSAFRLFRTRGVDNGMFLKMSSLGYPKS